MNFFRFVPVFEIASQEKEEMNEVVNRLEGKRACGCF